jgi:ribosomal protein S27AE
LQPEVIGRTAKVRKVVFSEMTCERCGGRMLSKVGTRPVRLVCTSCGSPVSLVHDGPQLQPLSSTLLLLGMGSFFVLLFFLTNPGRIETEQPKERALIKKLTTGEFIRDPELVEGSSHRDAMPSP